MKLAYVVSGESMPLLFDNAFISSFDIVLTIVAFLEGPNLSEIAPTEEKIQSKCESLLRQTKFATSWVSSHPLYFFFTIARDLFIMVN